MRIESITTAQARAVLEKWTGGMTAASPHFDNSEAYWEVRRQLSATEDHLSGYAVSNAQTRVWARVTTALTAMAKDGLLVKLGKGDSWPYGGTITQVAYYVPAAYERALTQSAEAREVRALVTARWELVSDQLKAWGLDPRTEPGQPVVLNLEDFERLVEMAAEAEGRTS